MNRTITMNLSGIIFHIEEDAYDKLNKYLSTIRSYFMDSDGKDEIMSDIESRIAEMLQEKVNQTKQAVLMMDVENVIIIMGKPEDFAGETAENTQNKQSSSDEHKMASGTAKRKRVFRDTDEKVIGGVCSGIANYFGFDPIWLRGAFAVSFFVFGTGLILYIILWIIMPEAKTTAEKLEMHGEKVDINNIGKAVNEEFDDLKKRMQDFGDKVGSPQTKARVRTSAQKTGDFIGDVLHNMVKVIVRIAAIFFMIIAVICMVILLGSIFGSANVVHLSEFGDHVSFSLYDLSDNFFPAGTSTLLAMIGLLLFFGIPLLGIIYGAIKFLFGIKQKHKIVKYTFNILWLCGLGILIFVGIQIGNDFKEEASVKQKIQLNQKDTMYLSIKDVEKYIDENYTEPRSRTNYQLGRLKWNYMETDKGQTHFNLPVSVDIVPSETDSFQLIEIKSASGKDKKEATYRAKNIKHHLTQTDSLIEFTPNFQIEQNDKWRGQEVKLILKVPQNKVIYLGKGMGFIIYDVDNVSNTWDSEMVGRRWIMKKDGLTCIDCDGLENEDTRVGPPSPPPLPKDKEHGY